MLGTTVPFFSEPRSTTPYWFLLPFTGHRWHCLSQTRSLITEYPRTISKVVRAYWWRSFPGVSERLASRPK